MAFGWEGTIEYRKKLKAKPMNTIWSANAGYGKYGSVSLGGYYISKSTNSFTSYTKRIVYRGGLDMKNGSR
jgi:hypothetical protein